MGMSAAHVSNCEAKIAVVVGDLKVQRSSVLSGRSFGVTLARCTLLTWYHSACHAISVHVQVPRSDADGTLARGTTVLERIDVQLIILSY